MSWQDRLLTAKFKGVTFKVESAERAGGRRTVTTEFPKRDLPFVEDLGRKARSFPVEAYVIGADYDLARNALLDVLESAGPGELQHPYHGTRQVIVSGFRVRESRDQGAIARFSIEFEESTVTPSPVVTPDASAALKASALAARVAASDEFLEQYNPGAFVASVETQLRNVTNAISRVITKVVVTEQAIASLRKRIRDLQANAAALVHQPENLLASVVGLFEDITQTGPELLELYNYVTGTRPPATTTNRLQEQTNFDATQRLVQRLVVTQAATLAPDQTYDSYQAAVTARDSIADLIDDQADTASDDTYPPLQQLRADLVRALPGVDSDLPHLLQTVPLVTVPSVVLAYRLYGNVDLEADLVARNRVRHPGFVVGGRALEVLSDE